MSSFKKEHLHEQQEDHSKRGLSGDSKKRDNEFPDEITVDEQRQENLQNHIQPKNILKLEKVIENSQEKEDLLDLGRKSDKQRQSEIQKEKDTKKEQKHIVGNKDEIFEECKLVLILLSLEILCSLVQFIERQLNDDFGEGGDKELLGIVLGFAFCGMLYLVFIIRRKYKKMKSKNDAKRLKHFFDAFFVKNGRNKYCILVISYLGILNILVIEIFLKKCTERLFTIAIILIVNARIMKRVNQKIRTSFSLSMIIYSSLRYVIYKHNYIYIIFTEIIVSVTVLLVFSSFKFIQDIKKVKIQNTRYIQEYFESFYHNIISMMPQGVLIIDESENLVYANKTSKIILECSSKNLILQLLSELIATQNIPSQQTQINKPQQSVFKSGRTSNYLPSQMIGSQQASDSLASSYMFFKNQFASLNSSINPQFKTSSNQHAVKSLLDSRSHLVFDKSQQTNQMATSPNVKQLHFQNCNTQSFSMKGQAQMPSTKLQKAQFQTVISLFGEQTPQNIQAQHFHFQPPQSLENYDKKCSTKIDPQSPKAKVLANKDSPFSYNNTCFEKGNLQNKSVMEIIQLLLKECKDKKNPIDLKQNKEHDINQKSQLKHIQSTFYHHGQTINDRPGNQINNSLRENDLTIQSQLNQNNFNHNYTNMNSNFGTNIINQNSEIIQNSTSVRVRLRDKIIEVTFVQCEMKCLKIKEKNKNIIPEVTTFNYKLNQKNQKSINELNSQQQKSDQTIHKQLQDKTAMILVFIEDVTQQEYVKLLEELNDCKIKMLSSVSHELKTPLNCSIGMLDEVQQFIQSDQFHQSNSADIIKNMILPAQQSNVLLLNMIRDLLDMGTLEFGEFRYNFSKFNLKEFLTDKCNIMRSQGQLKNIDIQFQFEHGIDDIVSDENRIGQMILNFLSNSLKYTGKNGKIFLRVEPYALIHFKIIIEDNGIGLSVCWSLAKGLTLDEFYDKPIQVNSEEKKGSTFWLVIKNQDPALINSTSENDVEEKHKDYSFDDKFENRVGLKDSSYTHYRYSVKKEDTNYMKNHQYESYPYKNLLQNLILFRNEDILEDLDDENEEIGRGQLKNNQIKNKIQKDSTRNKDYLSEQSSCFIYGIEDKQQLSYLMRGGEDGSENIKLDDSDKNGFISEKKFASFQENSIHQMLDKYFQNDFEDMNIQNNISISTINNFNLSTARFDANLQSQCVDFQSQQKQNTTKNADQQLKPTIQILGGSTKNSENKIQIKTPNIQQITQPNSIKSELNACATLEQFIFDNQQKKEGLFSEEFGQILIVDDVQFNLMTLNALLKKYSLKVDFAHDGEDAIQKVIKKYEKCGTVYQIIFMDLQMPIKDGFQATQEIRKYLTNQNISQIPIIATSSFSDQSFKDKAKKIGITTYLEKPLKIAQLDKMFEKYIIK